MHPIWSRAGLTIVAGAVLAVTAGCSSNTPAPQPAPAASTSSSSTSSSATSTSPTSRATTATGTGSGTGTGTSTTSASGTECKAGAAKAQVVPSAGGASAGHVLLDLKVTNGGSAACTLRGYPGVSLVVGTEGQQLGAPAQRAAGSETTVTLAPGAAASARLQLAQASNFPGCGVTTAAGFRVYLPNDTAAQFSPQSQPGCSNAAVIIMEISPFAGS